MEPAKSDADQKKKVSLMLPLFSFHKLDEILPVLVLRPSNYFTKLLLVSRAHKYPVL